MISDSFLSDAGWLFLGAWSVVVAAVSILAFGRDLLPSKASLDSVHKRDSSHSVQFPLTAPWSTTAPHPLFRRKCSGPATLKLETPVAKRAAHQPPNL